MKKSNCPDFEKLLDYVQQRLPDTQIEDVRYHLAECAECEREVAQLQILVSDLQEDSIIQVPVTAHVKAMALFSAWADSQPSPASTVGWRHLLAKLVFDTGVTSAATLAAGLRAETNIVPSHKTRQLLYSIENGKIEIDLQLRSASQSDRVNLIGQVLGVTTQERRIELVLLPQGQLLEAEVDETFTFEFQDLPAGEYKLNLHCDQELIEIPSITL